MKNRALPTLTNRTDLCIIQVPCLIILVKLLQFDAKIIPNIYRIKMKSFIFI